MLTGTNGMTLYTFTRDTPGVSNCNGNCAAAWPPLMASGTPVAAGVGVGISSAGYMIKNFKYAVLLVVVAAAVITPSGDAVTLSVFAVPMLILYCISIGVAWVTGKKRARRIAAAGD